MVVSIKEMINQSVNQEIETHLAWLGKVSGLKAEKMLRGKKTPYLFVLREGELEYGNQKDYYVTFVKPDFSIHHQPFVITSTVEGWHYENHGQGGIYLDTTSIDDVLHLIMHAPKDSPQPFIVT